MTTAKRILAAGDAAGAFVAGEIRAAGRARSGPLLVAVSMTLIESLKLLATTRVLPSAEMPRPLAFGSHAEADAGRCRGCCYGPSAIFADCVTNCRRSWCRHRPRRRCRPSPYSVLPSGDHTRPIWALVCLMTCVSLGEVLLPSATLYRKIYCVEFALSALPVVSFSVFWPAQMIAKRGAVRAELRPHRLAGDEIRVSRQARVQVLLNGVGQRRRRRDVLAGRQRQRAVVAVNKSVDSGVRPMRRREQSRGEQTTF